jgi:hypothetical protein
MSPDVKRNNDLLELEVSNGTAHWTNLSGMFLENFPAPRAYHGFVSVDGELLVLGGAVLEGRPHVFQVLLLLQWIECCMIS